MSLVNMTERTGFSVYTATNGKCSNDDIQRGMLSVTLMRTFHSRLLPHFVCRRSIRRPLNAFIRRTPSGSTESLVAGGFGKDNSYHNDHL